MARHYIGTAVNVARHLGVLNRLRSALGEPGTAADTAVKATRVYTDGGLGASWGRAFSDLREIRIKPSLWSRSDLRSDLVETFLHECAHIIADWSAPGRARHGARWRAVMHEMGCAGSKYTPRRAVTKPKPE